jgi:hypothetical protein
MNSASRLAFAVALLFAPALRAAVPLVVGGTPQAAILTRPSPPGYIQLAANELRDHLQRISGATLPIDTVGNEAAYPGAKFVYVGTSAAANAAGVTTTGLTTEHYRLRTIGDHAYLVGRDAGDDAWFDLTDCQPGTLFGVYHLLQEVLGVRWLWPGESGTCTPTSPDVTIPDLNLTAGPAMVQRKYRTPRIGTYLNGLDSYGFGIPVLPESDTRKTELAYEEIRWLRRMRMGTRKSPAFAHSFTTWWSQFGASNPEYFAELLPGRTQPHPAPDRVKLHDSSAAVWQKRVDLWVAAGAPNNLNICPNDSRSFCVCAACLALDRPPQAPEVVFESSAARLSDRLARFYTEIANRVAVINPNATVYGYAYDVYKYAPLEQTVPPNVALAYVPGAASSMTLTGNAETEAEVLGWIAQGCQQMYLRPNWMLAAHAGPCWPTRRLGEHFKRLTASGNILGFDSDSSCGSYSAFGLYYYLVCRLIADPTLSIDAILDEYCSGFGSAAARVRDYFTFWEHFLYNQADSGNTAIIGWATGMIAYGATYSDYAFTSALQILDSAYALLGPGETAARTRLDFLKVACVHGRLTAQAIDLVNPAVPITSNPQAARALRSLLAFRNQHAESFAIWREWMIDRESFVQGMEAYWTHVLSTQDLSGGSNVGAFIESAGQVVMEAENATAIRPGTGVAAGWTWQNAGTMAGASGTVMSAQPNTGLGDSGSAAPRLDYKVDFRTAGTFYVHLHLPTLPGGDDSVNIGLDGVQIANNLGNTTGSWRWRTTTATLNITTPGVHTFHIWMREDGCVVDKIILTTNATFTLPGTDLGPAESARRGSGPEPLLTVESGTGDGQYGADTIVAIAADAPPADYVFDRWTGATTRIADIFAASTTIVTDPQDTKIAASYQLSPAVDSEGDGIRDAWEQTHFGNLTTATEAPTSDFDRDGTSDRDEFLAGTAPTDPTSSLDLEIDRQPDGTVRLRWKGVPGKRYSILAKRDLRDAAWLPISIGIDGSEHTLPFDTTRRFLKLRVE